MGQNEVIFKTLTPDHWMRMNEIHCSVNRIDDPRRIVPELADPVRIRNGLLANKFMGWK